MQSYQQILLTIFFIVAATMLTRFLPFLIFPAHKQPPRLVLYLGQVLPAAVISLLVVYALRHVNPFTFPHGLPEAVTLIILTIIHLKWRHLLLSISVGTLLYMFLVQAVF